MTETIRILIADDHAVVRVGLRGFLATEPDLEVVGEATDGIETVEKFRSLQPDVILLDLVMLSTTVALIVRCPATDAGSGNAWRGLDVAVASETKPVCSPPVGPASIPTGISTA